MKKLCSFLMAVILSLTLVACSSGKDATVSTKVTNSEKASENKNTSDTSSEEKTENAVVFDTEKYKAFLKDYKVLTYTEHKDSEMSFDFYFADNGTLKTIKVKIKKEVTISK